MDSVNDQSKSDKNKTSALNAAQKTSEDTPSNNPSFQLWCLIEGGLAFRVKVEANQLIADLKLLVHTRGINPETRILAQDLVLSKVDIPFSGHTNATFKQLRFTETEGQVLEPEWQHVSYFWPAQPAVDKLHIFVKLPGPIPIPRRNSSPPRAPGNFAQRRATVAALYARLRYYGFIQVRGTPGSGKTTLARLLAHHIHTEERIKVIWISGWCKDTIGKAGGHRPHFKNLGWVEGDKTVFIFDEAQLTYWDVALWRDFFKNLHGSEDTQAIVFTSYGSASTRFYVVGAPIHLSDMQRVTLKAIPYKDNLPSVGLRFTKDEMDELVSVLYAGGHYFHERFFCSLLLVTGGHVGALCDFMRIIVADDSYRGLKSSAELYTWDTLMKMVAPRRLFTALSGTSVFTRGLPWDKDLQDVGVADLFSRVLRDGYVISPDTTGSYHDNLMRCFRNGWLHSNKKEHSGDTIIYSFASLLHRWFVEWKLWDRYPPPPIETGDILTFVISIIEKFSPKRLATERTLPFGEIQPVSEAQYQVEFYRCCSNGSIVTFPEYGTRQGRDDFYIPAKEWGVELLRNGDQLEEHSGRFSNNGSYATTLFFSDFIILDCRTTNPRDPHPGLEKLYHIVFSNDFSNVTILNNKLAHITQFKLLGSA